MQRLMALVNPKLRPTPPINKLRLFCYKIVINPKFEMFILSIIGLNTLVLLMYYDGASDRYDSTLNTLNIIFVFIFTLEAILKIIGHGINYYFKKK